MGCAFFYVSSTNHGFNMKIMGLVPILKKQGKIYHTKCDIAEHLPQLSKLPWVIKEKTTHSEEMSTKFN